MRVATWPELQHHLAATYRATTAGGDAVEVVVAGSPALVVTPIEVLGAIWIKIICVIGSPRHLSPMELLENNLRSAIGGFATTDGRLAMRHTLPLVGLRVADLDETIREIASVAAFTQQRLEQLS